MMGSSFSNREKLCGKVGKTIGALRKIIHSLLFIRDNFFTGRCGRIGAVCASTVYLLNLHSRL